MPIAYLDQNNHYVWTTMSPNWIVPYCCNVCSETTLKEGSWLCDYPVNGKTCDGVLCNVHAYKIAEQVSMTIFKDAQRIRSKPVARSKRVHKVPTEDQEQITLMSWAHRVKFGNGRLSDYLIHIPNGGSRNIIEAAKFKKMGVKAGVPDLQLLVPNGLIHGLWIELKSKTGKLQPSQRLMIQRLEEQGYLCKVCFGADEAINEIKKYLCLSS